MLALISISFSESPGLTREKQKGSLSASLQIDDKAITTIIDNSYKLAADKLPSMLKGPLSKLRPIGDEMKQKTGDLRERFETYEDDALVALIVLLPHLPQERALELEKRIIEKLTLPESGLHESSKYSTHLQDLEKQVVRFNTTLNQSDEQTASMTKALEEKNPEKIYEVYPTLRGIKNLLESHRRTIERTRNSIERVRHIDAVTLEKSAAAREIMEKERSVVLGALEKFKKKESPGKMKREVRDELDGAKSRLDIVQQNLETIKNEYLKELSGIADDFKKCGDENLANMKETGRYIAILEKLVRGTNVRKPGSIRESRNILHLRIGLFDIFSSQKEAKDDIEKHHRDTGKSGSRAPSRVVAGLKKTAAGIQRVGKTLNRGIAALAPEKEEDAPSMKSRALATTIKQHGALKEFRNGFFSLAALEEKASKHVLAAGDITMDYYGSLNELQKKLVVHLTVLPGKIEEVYKKYLLEYFGSNLYHEKFMIKERYDRLLQKSSDVKQDLQAITALQDAGRKKTTEMIDTTKRERETQAKTSRELMDDLKTAEEEYETKFSDKKSLGDWHEIIPMQKNLVRRTQLTARLINNFNRSVTTSRNFANGIRSEYDETRTGLEDGVATLKQDVDGYIREQQEFVIITEQAFKEKMKHVKSAYKMLTLLFGLLPNSDQQLNYLSQLQLKYKKKIYSRITMYNKDYFEESGGTATDQYSYRYRNSTTKTIKRTDLHFTALHWDAYERNFDYDVTALFGTELSLDYFKEEAKSNDSSIWVYDDGELPMFIEQKSETTRAYLPWMDVHLALGFRSRYTLGIGAGIMPWSYERITTDINYNRTIVKRLGPPIETEIISYTADWTNNFTGWGYRVGGSFEILNFLYGDWGFFFNWAIKIGETENTIVYSGALSNETRKHSLQGIRTNFQFNCNYTMNFLDFIGLRPILRFGIDDQKVYVGGDRYEYLSYRKYDLGIVFRY